MSFKRDTRSVGKFRPCHDPKGRRPVWDGPIPDRYYYIVRNIQVGPASWMVLYSDVRDDIRLIANIQGGHRSLIETERPIFWAPSNNGKLLVHGKVEQVKQALWESMDRRSPILGSRDNGDRLLIEGREVKDEEIFI